MLMLLSQWFIWFVPIWRIDSYHICWSCRLYRTRSLDIDRESTQFTKKWTRHNWTGDCHALCLWFCGWIYKFWHAGNCCHRPQSQVNFHRIIARISNLNSIAIKSDGSMLNGMWQWSSPCTGIQGSGKSPQTIEWGHFTPERCCRNICKVIKNEPGSHVSTNDSKIHGVILTEMRAICPFEKLAVCYL